MKKRPSSGHRESTPVSGQRRASRRFHFFISPHWSWRNQQSLARLWQAWETSFILLSISQQSFIVLWIWFTCGPISHSHKLDSHPSRPKLLLGAAPTLRQNVEWRKHRKRLTAFHLENTRVIRDRTPATSCHLIRDETLSYEGSTTTMSILQKGTLGSNTRFRNLCLMTRQTSKPRRLKSWAMICICLSFIKMYNIKHGIHIRREWAMDLQVENVLFKWLLLKDFQYSQLLKEQKTVGSSQSSHFRITTQFLPLKS